MKRNVVVLAEPLSKVIVSALGADAEIRRCDGTDRAQLLAAVAGADALIVRSATTVDGEVIAAGTRLRVLARAGVGLDNIDVAAASRAGVIVVNAPTANVTSAAELTVGLLLACARNIAVANAALKDHRWERATFAGTELAGKTVGVVGLGRVGTLVACRLAAFDMRVVAYDPYVTSGQAGRTGVQLVGLDCLLAESDFITVHLPRTADTVGLIGEEALRLVKPSVRIINTSRGGVVDEGALAIALKEGRVAGAGVDVFDTEPCTDSPLFEFDSVVVTPHLGASTAEAQERAAACVAQAVRRALAGGIPAEAVNVAGVAGSGARS